MKNFFNAIVFFAITSVSLISGYAIMHNSISELPEVDIYVYKAKSEQDAENKHKDFAKKLGYPDKVVNAFDKVRGFTKPVAEKLGEATKGWSVVIQQGVDIGTDALKKINELFASQIQEGVARLYRGKEHAYHDKVPRGNRGRFAEWNIDDPMYAIVTLPGSVVPLHPMPEYVGSHGRLGFAVISKPDPEDTTKKLYEVRFAKSLADEYVPAEQEKRDRSKIREAAKTSGQAALSLPIKK